jgi:hypothetical protein
MWRRSTVIEVYNVEHYYSTYLRGRIAVIRGGKEEGLIK